MENKKTAIIYARVSSRSQAEEELPIDSQLDACRRKASELGVEVIREFVEDGRSGRDDNRPAFRAAVDFCIEFGADHFITWSTSRFARNKRDAAVYKARLAHAGTRMTYVSQQLDADTDSGWLTESMLEIFDEFQSRSIAADTKRSMVRNAREGRWNGGQPPYGYRPAPDPRDAKRRVLVPNSSEARVVQEIFDLRLSGLGAKAIAEKLNARGHTRRGRRWQKAAIASILRAETVLGKTVFNRKDRRTGRVRDKTDWVVVNSHDPIIEAEVWDSVQQIMDIQTQPAAKGSPHSTHLFTGLLKCGTCGSSMQIETAKGRSRRYSYYNCRSAQKGLGCKNHRMPARDFDQWLGEIIMRRILSGEAVREAVADLGYHLETWEANRERALVRIRLELDELAGKTNNIFEIMEQHGKNTPNLGDLTLRLRAHNARIKELEAQEKQVMAESRPDIDVDESAIQAFRDDLQDIILSQSNSKRARRFIGRIVEKITVQADSVEIFYLPEAVVQCGKAVHSEENWLPGSALLGTAKILIVMPHRFWRRAA